MRVTNSLNLFVVISKIVEFWCSDPTTEGGIHGRTFVSYDGPLK